MRFMFDYGNDLMADEDFNEKEREAVMGDLEMLIQEYNNLKENLELEMKHKYVFATNSIDDKQANRLCFIKR